MTRSENSASGSHFSRLGPTYWKSSSATSSLNRTQEVGGSIPLLQVMTVLLGHIGRKAAPLAYDGAVSGQRVPGGVVHELPVDLREALVADASVLEAWKDITPLARNEFICWVEDAKKETTRERRIRRTREELEEGMRRPCCWPGCKHRERPSR
jgi:hypothetical protein